MIMTQTPHLGEERDPAPQCLGTIIFMGGWLFYYTNPSFCESISTGPAVRSDGIAVDNRSQVSHTQSGPGGENRYAVMGHT
jgi:hypothetical protein